MKKNKKNIEIVKKEFTDALSGYLKGMGTAVLMQLEGADSRRKSFGWSLYLSRLKKQYYLSIVQPRFEVDLKHESYISFTENLGLLKITIHSGKKKQTYERECHQRLPQSGQVRSYFKMINDSVKQQDDFGRLKTTGLVYMLSALYAELVFDAAHLDQYLKDSRRQMMIKINSSINGKIGTSFSAQDIATGLGYSIQHVNKVCQDFRGLSMNNYINFYKLEVFRSKLLVHKGRISDLAGECGFRDVNYLIQLFKRTYYITPLQLRKKLNDNSIENNSILHRTAGFELLKASDKPDRINQLSVEDKRCTLVVGNLSNEDIELYWVSPEKDEVPMNLLGGKDRIHFGSAEGHYWLLRKGKKSAYFQIGKDNCLIVF